MESWIGEPVLTSQPLQVLAVSGSTAATSSTRVVVRHVAGLLERAGAAVDSLDLAATPLPLFNPDTAYQAPGYPALRERVYRADVLVLATPDYHGSMSGALKNFLDHFWQEYTGKLFGTIVASHEKGLTVTDQLRTVARQCYAWSMPYAVAVDDKVDVRGGAVAGDSLPARLEMFARDLQVYGALLARQRRADLADAEPGFLARLRPRPTTDDRQPTQKT